MRQTRRLALLVTAPWPNQPQDAAMHNDHLAMYAALRARGFTPDEVTSLDGVRNRPRLLAFLRDVGRRLAGWRAGGGNVFLFYSGHGVFTGDTVKTARPGLWLAPPAPERPGDDPGERLFWDEAFAALSLPASVRLTLLPDC